MLSFSFYLLLSPFQAQATERGVTAYPDGIANFDAGAFPPPGVYLQYTFLYYNAPRIRANVPEDSHGEVVANIVRLVYSSMISVLGGNWGAHLVMPLVYLGSHLAPKPVSDYQFGVSNIAFSPFILAWHFGDYHITAAMDTLFPGSYNPKKLASPAQNYFTFQPVLGLGWLHGHKIGNQGRQFALGPALKYDYQRWSFMFIPQFEMATLNRAEGQRFWARVWYAF